MHLAKLISIGISSMRQMRCLAETQKTPREMIPKRILTFVIRFDIKSGIYSMLHYLADSLLNIWVPEPTLLRTMNWSAISPETVSPLCVTK